MSLRGGLPPALPRRVSSFWRHSFAWINKCYLDFGSLCGSMFVPFSIILASLVRASFPHRFVIDFGTNFGIIFKGLGVPYPFAHPTCKTFQIHYFYNGFACFYTSEKHDFHNFHDLCSLLVLALTFDDVW